MNNCGHFALTLSGSTQQLSEGIEDPTEKTAPIRWLSISAKVTNAALAYQGFYGRTLSANVYAQRIEIPVSSVPAAPLIFEGPNLSLDKVTVLGTLNEILMIGYIRG